MNRYYLSAILAFSIWGFFALILKPMAIFPSTDILVYRVCFAAAIMIISIMVSPKMLHRNLTILKSMTVSERRQSIYLTLLGGLLLTANWYFFIYSMNHISIKAAAYAYLVCPIITTVLATLFLGEKLKRNQWLAVILSIISCSMLAMGHWLELAYSLIVAFSYSFYLLSQRKNVRMERFFVLAIQLVFSAIILLPMSGILGVAIYSEFNFFFNIFLIALIFTILPLWLNLYALKGISSSVMGMLLYINPLLSFSLAALFFKEPVSNLQLTAYAIILLSIIIFNSKQIMPKEKSK
jgi:chloramphenicol-sensitive protein RarD